MLFNIIDERKINEFNPCVDAIYYFFEPNKDISNQGCNELFNYISEKDKTSGAMWHTRILISDAVKFCCGTRMHITMYIYDPGYVVDNMNYLTSIHPLLSRNPINKMVTT